MQGFHGWHERGYLPHRDEPGLTQFVTFHLADSYPVKLRSEWEHFIEIEDDRTKRSQLEAYLDKGRGECHLRHHRIASLIEENLRRFAGDRYELSAWVIMPNHVHVLFKTGKIPMMETVGAWKRHTGRLANRILGRRGAFWAADYFDVYMRNEEHESKTISYIESNPSKAKLVLNPKDWLWSSAPLRDPYGKLEI